MSSVMDEIRDKASAKKSEIDSDPSSTEKERKKIRDVVTFFSVDKGLSIIPMGSALAILEYVGYDGDEPIEMYSKAMFELSSKERYTYVDPDKL